MSHQRHSGRLSSEFEEFYSKSHDVAQSWDPAIPPSRSHSTPGAVCPHSFWQQLGGATGFTLGWGAAAGGEATLSGWGVRVWFCQILRLTPSAPAFLCSAGSADTSSPSSSLSLRAPFPTHIFSPPSPQAHAWLLLPDALPVSPVPLQRSYLRARGRAWSNAHVSRMGQQPSLSIWTL